MKLKEYKDELQKCVNCGNCREMVYKETGTYKICPLLEKFGFESYSARGRVKIARAILTGNLKYSPQISKRVFSCLLCGNCEAHCALGVDIAGITEAMRQDLIEEGLELPKNLQKVISNIKEKHNVFGKNIDEGIKWSKPFNLPEKGEVLYFAGCYASYKFTETAKATVNILRKGGIEPAYLGKDEQCCGIVALYSGLEDLGRQLVEHNVEAIEASGAKQVVTSCAGCYHVLKTEYPKIVGELPFKVVHISEVINDLIKGKKLELKKTIDKKVTYHDPCHLGRFEEVYDPPREIIKSIPGITFKEMRRNRENSWCCGGGTTVYSSFPDLTRKVAKEKIKDIPEDAEIIVTACPLCKEVLSSSIKNKVVYDLPVIVSEALES